MIKEQEIEEPLDFFCTKNLAPQKLLFRVCNAWLVQDMQKNAFEVMQSYGLVFGKCYNKLRLILDLTGICYKLSNFFQSDGTFDSKIKVEILAKAGQKEINEILAALKYWKPYTLNRNDKT